MNIDSSLKKVLGSAVLFLLPTMSAHAEDFTFNVPVELTDLHADIKRGAVEVEVFDGTVDFTKSSSVMHLIGRGGEVFEIAGGIFSGTVTVKFDARKGRPPGEAVYYRVTLNLEQPHVAMLPASSVMKRGLAYAHDETKPFLVTAIGKIGDPAWKYEAQKAELVTAALAAKPATGTPSNCPSCKAKAARQKAKVSAGAVKKAP